MLAGPVVVGGDIGLTVAGSDFVKDVESTDALASSEVLCLDRTITQFGDARGKALRGGAEPGKVLWPGGYDCQCFVRSAECRRGKSRCTSTCKCGACKKLTTFHMCLPDVMHPTSGTVVIWR